MRALAAGKATNEGFFSNYEDATRLIYRCMASSFLIVRKTVEKYKSKFIAWYKRACLRMCIWLFRSNLLYTGTKSCLHASAAVLMKVIVNETKIIEKHFKKRYIL